jgi:hypothetical protein
MGQPFNQQRTKDADWVCLLSLHERAPFRGAKGDKLAVHFHGVHPSNRKMRSKVDTDSEKLRKFFEVFAVERGSPGLESGLDRYGAPGLLGLIISTFVSLLQCPTKEGPSPAFGPEWQPRRQPLTASLRGSDFFCVSTSPSLRPRGLFRWAGFFASVDPLPGGDQCIPPSKGGCGPDRVLLFSALPAGSSLGLCFRPAECLGLHEIVYQRVPQQNHPDFRQAAHAHLV